MTTERREPTEGQLAWKLNPALHVVNEIIFFSVWLQELVYLVYELIVSPVSYHFHIAL